jgi:hypothetical protein
MAIRTLSTEPIPDAPLHCAYCGEQMDGTCFRAVSRTSPAVGLCESCIRIYGRLVNLNRLVSVNYAPFSWDILHEEIKYALRGVVATPALKRAVTCLILRLSVRTSAILSGLTAPVVDYGPYKAVSLLPARFGIIAESGSNVYQAIDAAASVVGLPVVERFVSEDGMQAAISHLQKLSGSDPLLFQHGIVFLNWDRNVLGVNDLGCSVVFHAPRKYGIPSGIHVFDGTGEEDSSN